jgi:hypothetical protein
MASFSEIVDAVVALSFDEQQTLLEILERSVGERSRTALARDVASAREEYAKECAQPTSADDILIEVSKS